MKKTTFLIIGRHAVTEALKNPKRKVHRLFITEEALKKLNKDNQNINLTGKTHIFYKSKKEIDNLCGKEDLSHQNIVAEIEELDEINLKDYVFKNKKENLNIIALEEVACRSSCTYNSLRLDFHVSSDLIHTFFFYRGPIFIFFFP